MVCSDFFYVFMFFIFFLNDVKCIYIIQSRVVWSLMDSKSRAAGQVIHRLMSTHPLARAEGEGVVEEQV